MKTKTLLTVILLSIILVSCAPASISVPTETPVPTATITLTPVPPTPTESPKPAETILPTKAIQPTQVVIPTDLVFSTPLVQVLRQSGLSILSVQGSVYMSIFQSTDKAVWIETNEGIINAVFFADSVEVEQIRITEQPDKSTGRYLYTIQAPPPTLLHDQTIDAAFPLYFTAKSDMLMVTSSEKLDKTLKHIFSGQ